jgi:hypothetical protein
MAESKTQGALGPTIRDQPPSRRPMTPTVRKATPQRRFVLSVVFKVMPSAVTFMDSAAWLAIMAYEHRVHDWGMKFRLVHVPANIRRIFEVTGTEYLFSEAVGARTDGRDQEVRS